MAASIATPSNAPCHQGNGSRAARRKVNPAATTTTARVAVSDTPYRP